MSETDLPYWNADLDKPILLRDGKELRTLHEAVVFLEERFIGQRGVQLTGVLLALKFAARTGAVAEILDARRVVEILLRGNDLA
ncbi:hypothetical protein G3545_06100 [Starkeya sp. ORNL1]|uniref:hypothetical protein n=1 Tax=Starkeya sp. ORNL1 TaxID=2709380 RepID=UPI00146478D9|nr:hypothetical protein [Starkeya sp. ORNL1]QJP13258.1 hypothetical protein G3545_06100 [Starkeya sp. ORNL1]